jgi:hypothetical protein
MNETTSDASLGRSGWQAPGSRVLLTISPSTTIPFHDIPYLSRAAWSVTGQKPQAGVRPDSGGCTSLDAVGTDRVAEPGVYNALAGRSRHRGTYVFEAGR